jgi:hypothetical protein
MAVLLTHNLFKTVAEKIKKCVNLALEIQNIWKLNDVSVYPTVISADGVATRSFLKYLQDVDLTKKNLKISVKSSTV